MSHVTKREAQAVADFATRVAEALHLPRWKILVMEDTCDEDALASIDQVYGKHTAQLYLCSDWMKRTEDERRETVIHEVCHLIHTRVNDVVDEAQAYMHKHEHSALWSRYERETELMVDHLAMFLDETHTLRQAWDQAHGRT